jgi:DNA repair protein RecN (Recombination protein N)
VRDSTRLNAQLEEQGVEPCEEAQLLVKRVFSTTGTNRQFINGSPTTLAVLKELGDGLIDLHGPHDHQSLLANDRQLALLDAFAGAESLRAQYEERWRQLNAVIAEHEELSTNEAALEREVDLLRHQVQEIEAANLRPNEEEELLARYSVVANSRRLLELSTQIAGKLSEADDAVLTRLGEVGKLLRDLERIDPGAAQYGEAHVRALTELEELARGVQGYAEELEIEPGELRTLEERVTLFETLKRKYGGSIVAVIEFGAQAGERLQKIESRGAELLRLEKEIESGRKALLEIGAQLSKKRRTGGPKLASGVTAHLRTSVSRRRSSRFSSNPLEKPAPLGLKPSSSSSRRIPANRRSRSRRSPRAAKFRA